MLRIYTLDDSEQWDSIVRTFEKYDVYWLSGYVRAFFIHGDGDPILFYYDDGTTRGISVVMKRDIALDRRFEGKIEKGRYYDLCTPYGYGGWLIEGGNRKGLFDSYLEWIVKNSIVSEFVRFHPMVKNHESCVEFYETIQLGQVVHIPLGSPEEIWDNITSKNRGKIRKAIKNDIEIYNGRFPDIFEKFREIYNATMERDEAEEYYYFGSEFYDSVLRDLPQNAQVFWADMHGEVIAATIIAGANGYLNYHLSGSKKDYGSLAPGNLMLYKAALWGAANGYKSLYLGGGVGSGEDSLFKFKRAFNKGDLNHFYIGKRIFDKEMYDQLVSCRESIENKGFFPEYRG